MDTSYAIDIEHLSKSFGSVKAVDDVSLRVKKGEIYGFLGPNGSGKTTTIRMICGLLTPDAGEGQCLGYDIVTQSYQIKKQVGYMPQRFSLYEDLSIKENLNFIARLYDVPDLEQKTQEALAELGLSSRQNQLAGTLSGGWKQRLALAAALIHDPQLLLLDEPTAGVDPKARRDFWDHIHELSDRGITSLVSTHYMDEAERCHRLAYIMNGKILLRGTTEEIIAQIPLNIWQVTGNQITELAHLLKQDPDIDQVTYFGNILHIGTKNESTLYKYQQSELGKKLNWQHIPPNLEDIFVNMVSQHGDKDAF